MMNRRTVVLSALSAAIIGPMRAAAAERTPFDRAKFDAALKSGRPVLVDISATWCSTCQRQKQIIAGLIATPKFAGYQIFEVDYDRAKDVMRSFKADQRATLIAFKGGAEVGRVVWDTAPAVIEGLLAKAL
jgi:thioredoxin-like negative regulator of GroEL